MRALNIILINSTLSQPSEQSTTLAALTTVSTADFNKAAK